MAKRIVRITEEMHLNVAVYDTQDEARAENDGFHQSVKTSLTNGDPANGWMNWNPNGFQLAARSFDIDYPPA